MSMEFVKKIHHINSVVHGLADWRVIDFQIADTFGAIIQLTEDCMA